MRRTILLSIRLRLDHQLPHDQVYSQGYNQCSPGYGQPSSAHSWNSWDDRTFGIETKIAEYRSQVQQQRTLNAKRRGDQEKQQHAENLEPQDDLFSEFHVELKAAKTVGRSVFKSHTYLCLQYRVHDPKAAERAPRQSLFEVKEMDPFMNTVS